MLVLLSNEAFEPEIGGSEPGDLIKSIVWVVIALAIVITLILFVIKWLSNRTRQWGANRAMRTLGGVSLGQSSSMQVVEIAGRIYIVGVGEDITLLDKIVDEEEVSAVLANLQKQTEHSWTSQDLKGFLKKFVQRKDERDVSSNLTPEGQTTFEQLLQSKLSEQTGRKQQLESLLQEQKTKERLMNHEK